MINKSKTIFLIIFISLISVNIFSQPLPDSTVIRNIYTQALTQNYAYKNLEYLCKNYANRLCGTDQSLRALAWTEDIIRKIGVDTIYRQPCIVRNWHRGDKEIGNIISAKHGTVHTHICALGGSVGTPPQGIKANIIEIQNFDELKKYEKKIKGKIVFFNRPANPEHIYTFEAYGGAADQRFHGPSEAAKYGAVGVIVRSITLASDTFPHTGIMKYEKDLPQLPCAGISTNDADSLSKWLKADSTIEFYLKQNCYELPETTSYNLIAEIKGTEHPENIIAFGGHIDCWDNCQGAHDDGCGVLQTIEVLKIFKSLNLKPKNTIRVVVFMDEEIWQRGARKYAEIAKNEKHIAAIESDRGGFTPFGFSMDADNEVYKKVDKWKNLLLPYGLYIFEKGYSGVDIGFLKEQKVPLFALITDSQRYFDYQHAASDTFDKINKRELELGSAAITSLVYLIDKYGLGMK